MPNIQGADELVVAYDRDHSRRHADDREPPPVRGDSDDHRREREPDRVDRREPEVTPTAITWLEGGTGDADFVIAAIDVTRGGSPLPSDAQYTRTIIAPHAGMSLAIPLVR